MDQYLLFPSIGKHWCTLLVECSAGKTGAELSDIVAVGDAAMSLSSREFHLIIF